MENNNENKIEKAYWGSKLNITSLNKNTKTLLVLLLPFSLIIVLLGVYAHLFICTYTKVFDVKPIKFISQFINPEGGAFCMTKFGGYEG